MTNYLTTLRGSIHASTLAEIFSYSLAIASNDEPSVVAQKVRDAWVAVLKTGGSKLDPHFHTGIVWDRATAALILDLHTGTLGAAAHSIISGGSAGVGTNLSLPPQCAIAISFKAGTHPNGAPIKGRFYLPPPVNSVMTAQGLLDTSLTPLFRDQIKSFFTTLRAGGAIPSVWSRKDGNLTSIQEVRVGNKIDTVRRRRNSLPETYVTTSIP